jgi:hypothetical protein
MTRPAPTSPGSHSHGPRSRGDLAVWPGTFHDRDAVLLTVEDGLIREHETFEGYTPLPGG